MLNYGLPLSIASIISTFQGQFYVFILPIFAAPDLMGNYGIASTFVVLITFFATPVSTMLFPAFSKLDPQKDRETLKNVFQFSVKYASLLVVPAATIVMTLSSPGISVLFPQYTEAPLFLALLTIQYYLYAALGNPSVRSLINGQGQTRFSLKLSIIDFAITFPLGILLISQFGILGIIVATLIAGAPSLIIALRWTNKHYGVTVDWSSSARILLSGAIASATTYALTMLIKSNWVALFVGATAFLLIFTITIIYSHAINRSDISQIRESITALGPLGRIANLVLNIVERLMTALQPRPKGDTTYSSG
jgi:O-antigen/teichoic acid export membrane protein